MLYRSAARAQCWIYARRPVFARLASTQPPQSPQSPQSPRAARMALAAPDAAEPKPYDAILREMEGRAAQWDDAGARIGTHFLNRACRVDELYKPLDLGDVVLLNLEPVVVIGTPDVPDGPYIVADAVGRAKEVFRSMVDARLMSLVSAARVRSLGGRLFMPDSAATDMALELGVEPSVSSSAPTSKVVSQAVHRLIARPLRHLYNDAMKRAQRLLPGVSAALGRRQQQRATTSSFVDLVLEVCPSEASTYVVADFYAVRLCLDHYTLVHKCLLDFSYTGKYAFTVLPLNAERRNLKVIYGNNTKQGSDFIADYARENVPSAEGESRAIELLRERYPSAGRLDSAAAAELLRLPLGGVRGKLRYSWFTSRDGDSGCEVKQTRDQLKRLRQEFDAPVYCIDSADALEVDDGISLERLSAPNTVRLGVHIANPSAFTDSGPLVQELLKQPTTVYELNGAAIPMLPRALTGAMGLISGERRASLSLFVDLDLQTRQFSNVELAPLMLSRIVNKTPEEVNASRDEFADFFAAAQALRAQRLANGAFDMESSADGIAYRIVSEFMLMANHLVAVYCQEREIPLLYRAQRVLTQSAQLQQDYAAALQAQNGLLGFAWRPVVQKSVVSVVPEKHIGIGYDATTRFTSPLRRLEDYIAHCQIGAHLQGAAPPFSETDLARMVPWLQVSQELVREYQRQLVLFDTLPKVQPGERLDGVVSHVAWGAARGPASRTRVYLPKYGVEADYVGAAELAMEETREFVVDAVGVYAGCASVLLPDEAGK